MPVEGVPRRQGRERVRPVVVPRGVRTEFERDALLEQAGVGIRVLVGVQDVAALLGEKSGDRGDDAGSVGS